MGRWAQYRHRGTGLTLVADSGFSLSAPTIEQFTVGSAALAIGMSMADVCPEGADGIKVQYRVSPDGAWQDVDDCVCDESVTVLDPCSLFQGYSVRIAWANGGVQASDWSEPLNVTCSI